ncbi:arylesterase [Geopsychrobacter electrodiphilus]|uniref:arylesterase n=1 Tax=Geopsychrobacter electrodiphilus TaxID=225196 RepID=UPI00036EB3EF|nr:arylesterase [Geopsychrobacter electrodiphilus]
MQTPRFFWLGLALLLFVHMGWASGLPLRITVLGDSLTAGYGLAAREAFPAQLERALQKAGYRVLVQNAGVSGDTSAGGLARLDWSLAARPDLMIVELGANDALRGLDPELTHKNLDAILTRLKAAGVPALLTGMKAPRNLGPDYYTKFDRLYPELAERHAVPFYPFFLEGVAGRAELNQADGLHPNTKGVALIVGKMLPLIAEQLKRLNLRGASLK